MEDRVEGCGRRLLDAWRDNLPAEGHLAGTDEPEMAEALQRAHEDGQAAWPRVVLDAERFVAYLAPRAPTDVAPLVALQRLHRTDLYLCCACCDGDAAAHAAFDRHASPDIDLALRRVSGAEAVADDVRQTLRERFLVAADGKPPRLAQYTGQGSLGGWVRIAAVRQAHRLLRRHGRELPLETQRLAVAAGAGDDLELGYLKRTYRAEFRQAFAAALDGLPPRDRNLLRYRYLDDLNIDQIGTIQGVHRATVARWLAATRLRLLDQTRAQLGNRLALDATEVESVMRLIHSQLPASIVAHLARDGGAE